jgi:hypothetical protein
MIKTRQVRSKNGKSRINLILYVIFRPISVGCLAERLRQLYERLNELRKNGGDKKHSNKNEKPSKKNVKDVLRRNRPHSVKQTGTYKQNWIMHH